MKLCFSSFAVNGCFFKFNHKVASVVKDRKEIQTKTIKSLKENHKIRTNIKINIFIECHFCRDQKMHRLCTGVQ
jgi:hypothetical protein